MSFLLRWFTQIIQRTGDMYEYVFHYSLAHIFSTIILVAEMFLRTSCRLEG